jgi:hypothetical protein
MSDIKPKKPNGEGDPQLMVGGVTLSEFFSPQKMGYKITRQELVQVLAIYTTKADVHEAMKVLDFGLRRAIRQTILEEREAMEAEEKPESPIITL